MHFRLSVITALFMLVFAGSAFGQMSIYIGAGPSIDAGATSAAGGNLIIGLGSDSTGTASYTIFDARGPDPKHLTYSSFELLRQRIITAGVSWGSFELAGLAGPGAVVTQNSTAAAGTLGGEITFHPKKWPNWGISGSGRAMYSPANSTGSTESSWKPWVMVHAGYTFRATKQ